MCSPPYDAWPGALAENRAISATWRGSLGGIELRDARAMARSEAIEVARAFSSRIGVEIDDPPEPVARIVMTGHQPDLFHPGVWVKAFLLQRLADETNSTPVNLVVDTDAFGTIALSAPCMRPEVAVCTHPLLIAARDACYACSSVPTSEDIADFRKGGGAILSTLPAPALGRHFSAFCDALELAAPTANNLAELITFARRRYEVSAGTRYLELPVSAQFSGRAASHFISEIACRAEEFATCHNEALGQYRRRNGIRTAAQPFPDLEIAADVEMPFWVLWDGKRRSVSVAKVPRGIEMRAGGEALLRMPTDAARAADAIFAAGVAFGPKAMALTAYNRLLVSDLFIHGIGGSRYDVITDEVVERFFGVRLGRFVVASMTMYLPLGAPVVTDADIEVVERRLKRIEHNPDDLLADASLESAEDRELAESLTERKSALLGEIARSGADKKTLGQEIRAINEQLGGLAAPLRAELEAERERLMSLRAASEVLTDRTYPFCLWSPLEILDKVR